MHIVVLKKYMYFLRYRKCKNTDDSTVTILKFSCENQRLKTHFSSVSIINYHSQTIKAIHFVLDITKPINECVCVSSHKTDTCNNDLEWTP